MRLNLVSMVNGVVEAHSCAELTPIATTTGNNTH